MNAQAMTARHLAIKAKSRRKELGLSQAEVAKKTGLKQKTISAFENKPDSLMLKTALLIIQYLDLQLSISNSDEFSDDSNAWKEEW